MRVLPTLVLLGCAVVGTTCQPRPQPVAPSEACLAVLDCYFGDDPLSAVPGFEGLFPEGNDIVRETYGEGGTCWLEGPGALADSCTDRCKGLLWQDCARSYRRVCAGDAAKACLVDEDCGGGDTCVAAATEDTDEDGVPDSETPFCGTAVACSETSALRCRFEDFAVLQGEGRQPDEPLFSACPAGTECNAVPPDFEGPEVVPATTPGCCENAERGLLVGDRETCNP